MALHCYISYIYRLACDRPDACGQHHLRGPRDSVALRRNALSSPPTSLTSLPACYLMRPRCASRRARSMPPRRRSPCAYAQRRPLSPVRCAPSQRGVSTAVTSVRSLICRGRIIACAYSCACASGFVTTPTACGVSSPNGCPPSLPLGRGAPGGWPNASWPSGWPWGARPGYVWATRGLWP